MVDSDIVKEELPALAGSSYWVVISQTCNLFNPSLERVPSVELIAAERISVLEKTMASGLNPRVLHTKAYDAQSQELLLELKIQRRVWVPRNLLSMCSPSGAAIRDLEGDTEGRFKETLTNWIARSYTRIELPDELNEAIQKSRLDRILSKISKLDHGVHGIFFEIALHSEQESDDEDAVDPEPLSPSQVAISNPPWSVELSVVCYDQDTKASVMKILAEADDLRYEAKLLPDPASHPGKNVSVRQLAAAHGLHVIGLQAVMDDAWRVTDLMRTQRYTNFDYLSGVPETDV